MANTGNVFPGTGENNAGIGATAWTNPGNIVSDNTTDASCAAGASSQYLVARNFNFASVPTNATIAGVVVRIEASESSAGSETLNARLQDAAGALAGTGKTASINGTGKTVYTYGTTSDVWGASPTGNMVHDADFGVRFWYTTAHTMAVDYVTMALEYTVPAPGVATETNAAAGLAVTKLRAVGGASEADTAQAPLVEIVGGQEVATGLATETDAAAALAALKRVAAGTAAETDDAGALAAVKLATVGAAGETDAAATNSAVKLVGVGAVAETDAAFAPGAAKLVGSGEATEADTSTALGATKLVASGVAAEADTATARQAVRVIPSMEWMDGWAAGLETDTATALAAVRVVGVGAAAETDEAFSLYAGGTQIPVGAAAETDTALALAVVKIAGTGAANETDSAGAPWVNNVVYLPVAAAGEADRAHKPLVWSLGTSLDVLEVYAWVRVA